MSNAFVVAGSSIIAGRGQGWHDGPLPNPHHWKTPDWKTAMMLPDARLIVFDKDGVLLDLNQTWMPLVVSLAEHLTMRAEGCVERDDLLAAVGVEMIPGTDDGQILENSVFAAGTFMAMREIWQEMAPGLKSFFEDKALYRAEIQRIHEATVKGNTVAKGNVGDELERLRGQGYALAVATNDTTSSAMLNLNDMGIADAFDAIICADSGFNRKPEPDGLLEACRIASCTPNQAIMVGDTQTDWLAAHNAGYGGFVAIADGAPELPGFIPSADLVLAEIDGLAQRLKGS